MAGRKKSKPKKAARSSARAVPRKPAKSKKRAEKKPAPEKRSDQEILFWFVNHLASYFGDNGYDDLIVADLHKMFPDYPFVEENFRRGIDLALALPGMDQRKIVGYYANRRANTAEQARAWLRILRDKLFAAAQKR